MQGLLKIILISLLFIIGLLFFSHLEFVTEYIFTKGNTSEVKLINKEYKVYVSIDDRSNDTLNLGFTIVKKNIPLKISDIFCEINESQFLLMRFNNHYLIEIDISNFGVLPEQYKIVKGKDRIFSYDFLFNKNVLNKEMNELEFHIKVNGKQINEKIQFEEVSNLKFISGHGDPSVFIIYILIIVVFFLSLPIISNLMKNNED